MTVWIQNPFDNLPCEGYRKQRYWLMAEAFARAGHSVVLWTSDFSHGAKAPRQILDSDLAQRCGFTLRLIPTRPYAHNVGLARVLSHRAYARTWLRLALSPSSNFQPQNLQPPNPPSLIISSTPHLSAAAAALRLGRHFGAKVVIDVMDAWPETFIRLAPRALRGLAALLLTPLTRLSRRLYREADFVTGVCERYRALTGRDDYYLAYHGVELTNCQSETVEHGPIRLVYAGHVGKTYDLATVFRAVEENPDFTLDLAGRWTGPVPARVTVHGYLGQDALQKLLASCDIGIIPMNPDSWVGVPYKFCDYTQAGLRIVSSLGGESTALLERYACGVPYRPGDSRSLAVAIRAAVRLDRTAARKLCAEVLDANEIYPAYVKTLTSASFTGNGPAPHRREGRKEATAEHVGL